MDLSSLSGIPPWDWPEDADEMLLNALRDRGVAPDERTLAAELASSLVVMGDELARALLEVVGEPGDDPEFRGQAAIALGPTLEEALLDDYGLDPEADAPVSEEVATATRTTLWNVYTDPEAPGDPAEGVDAGRWRPRRPTVWSERRARGRTSPATSASIDARRAAASASIGSPSSRSSSAGVPPSAPAPRPHPGPVPVARRRRFVASIRGSPQASFTGCSRACNVDG